MRRVNGLWAGRLWTITLLLVGLGVLTACGGAGGTAGAPPSSSPQGGLGVTDKNGLVSALKAAGVTLTPAGNVQQPFLSAQGEAYETGSGPVQVFEYGSEGDAGKDASKIGRDGTIAGSSVGWMAQPHFYRSGKLLVIYVGTDEKVISALGASLGAAFATGPKVAGPQVPQGTPQP